MRNSVILILLVLSLGATAFSSVKLITSTITPSHPSPTAFSYNVSETLVVDKEGYYTVVIHKGNLNLNSLYVIVVFQPLPGRGNEKTVVLTLSSESEEVKLHRGVYEVIVYFTGTTPSYEGLSTIQGNLSVTIFYKGEN
ncbi:MAG: hypothetical protein RXS23_10365 [Metallosphaera yellowstonensis]|jgi:hypothetical protein